MFLCSNDKTDYCSVDNNEGKKEKNYLTLFFALRVVSSINILRKISDVRQRKKNKCLEKENSVTQRVRRLYMVVLFVFYKTDFYLIHKAKLNLPIELVKICF